MDIVVEFKDGKKEKGNISEVIENYRISKDLFTFEKTPILNEARSIVYCICSSLDIISQENFSKSELLLKDDHNDFDFNQRKMRMKLREKRRVLKLENDLYNCFNNNEIDIQKESIINLLFLLKLIKLKEKLDNFEISRFIYSNSKKAKEILLEKKISLKGEEKRKEIEDYFRFHHSFFHIICNIYEEYDLEKEDWEYSESKYLFHLFLDYLQKGYTGRKKSLSSNKLKKIKENLPFSLEEKEISGIISSRNNSIFLDNLPFGGYKKYYGGEIHGERIAKNEEKIKRIVALKEFENRRLNSLMFDICCYKGKIIPKKFFSIDPFSISDLAPTNIDSAAKPGKYFLVAWYRISESEIARLEEKLSKSKSECEKLKKENEDLKNEISEISRKKEHFNYFKGFTKRW